MTYLSEDPTYLVGGLLLFAGASAIALKVTQQGKYLLYAGIAVARARRCCLDRMGVGDRQ